MAYLHQDAAMYSRHHHGQKMIQVQKNLTSFDTQVGPIADNPLTVLLAPHRARIVQAARGGDSRALRLIALYVLYCNHERLETLTECRTLMAEWLKQPIR
jgi:hypothetical protein